MKRYRHIDKLGQGGNGIVWKVSNNRDEIFAKKVLKNIRDTKAYSRFKDEVKILSDINYIGVIKVLDSYLPEKYTSKNEACYVMPLGIPLKNHITNIQLDDTFNIIMKIIDTIEYLHDKDITHRDLKIENILIVDGEPKISDFGLANFPKQVRVSRLNEKIGPAFTIAPEMKRISSTAEYKKADIYSLAKTIWVILTKQWLSFDGQYNNYSKISLPNYINLIINKTHLGGQTHYFSIVILEKLLRQATHNDAEERPNIKEFKESFKLWMDSNATYFLRNNIEWIDALEKIFPISIPLSSEWNNVSDMEKVLTIIFSHYDNLNHCFFPRSGGLDFNSVRSINIVRLFVFVNKRNLLSKSFSPNL